MNILLILIPAALVLAGIGVLGFRWAVRSGQYDDIDTPALRILPDDEAQPPPASRPKPNT